MSFVHIDCAGDFRPGDSPPEGYIDWHEWARIQEKAGLRQQQCGICSRWQYPQQLSSAEIVSHLVDGKTGEVVEFREPVCLECEESRKL